MDDLLHLLTHKADGETTRLEWLSSLLTDFDGLCLIAQLYAESHGDPFDAPAYAYALREARQLTEDLKDFVAAKVNTP